jgi:hypothetical protein
MVVNDVALGLNTNRRIIELFELSNSVMIIVKKNAII